MKILLVILIAFSFLVSITWTKNSTFAEGTYSDPGTDDSSDCSQDCLTWTQSPVWVIDKYGKFIVTTQKRAGLTHFMFSNDEGANWTQSTEGYNALLRGSMAYDSVHDVIHVIWDAEDKNDGIIYRRYSITRDGSNNITSIQRMDTGVNLQLDVSSASSFEFPIAVWKDDGSANGILVAIWSKMGTNFTEIRASMRRLSMTDADGVAGNWIALDGTGDTFSSDPPLVEADKIYGAGTSGDAAIAAKIRGGSGSHKDDFYFFTAANISGGVPSAVLAKRMNWSSGALNWSGGTTDLGTVGQINNLGGGYSLKWQLISNPVIDTTNDRLYIGWSRWKDNTAGDTVSVAYLNSSDSVSSTIDIYSANGTHSYAPTFGISFDNTAQKLYIGYTESTTNGDNGSLDYKTYDGITLSSEIRFYTSPGGSGGEDGAGDGPAMMQDRLAVNNRIYLAFRVNGSLPPSALDPHTIRIGYIQLAAPTPTPSPTPSSQPSNSSSSSIPSSGPSTASCTDTAPNQAPDLFQIDPAGTYANLYFSTVKGSTGYNINYGLKPDDLSYGDSFDYSGTLWNIGRTISNLNPNTTYYFKVQAANGCNAGPWSTIKSVKTKNRLANVAGWFANLNPLSDKPTLVTSKSTSIANTPALSNNCIYAVRAGDSLWMIAQSVLGSGAGYIKIVNLNLDQLKPGSTLIRAGQNLKIC